GLDGDAVVARGNVAALDAHMAARVDVDAAAVAARGADDKTPDGGVFAVGGMDAPHQSVLRRESLEPDVITSNRLDERRVAKRVLCSGSAAERRMADDSARPDYRDAPSID